MADLNRLALNGMSQARNSINPLVQKKRIGMFSTLQENPWTILLMKIKSL